MISKLNVDFHKKPNAGFSFSGSLPKSAKFLRLLNKFYIRWCKNTPHIYILTRFDLEATRGTDPEFVSSSPSSADFLRSAAGTFSEAKPAKVQSVPSNSQNIPEYPRKRSKQPDLTGQDNLINKYISGVHLKAKCWVRFLFQPSQNR